MAFKRYGNLNNKSIRCMNDVPVKSGGSVSEGMALMISDTTGRVEKFTTGNKFLAVLEFCPTALTGDAGGTVKVEQLEIQPGRTFFVLQGDLSDANTQVGDLVDIGSDGLSITTKTNGDFRVLKRILRGSTKYVVVVPINNAFPG